MGRARIGQRTRGVPLRGRRGRGCGPDRRSPIVRERRAMNESSSERVGAMPNPPHLGELIHESMEEVGWNVTETAARLHCERGTPPRLLNGRAGPSANVALSRRGATAMTFARGRRWTMAATRLAGTWQARISGALTGVARSRRPSACKGHIIGIICHDRPARELRSCRRAMSSSPIIRPPWSPSW